MGFLCLFFYAHFIAKQTRKDRKILDYYEHIRLSKRSKLFHEVIFQLGDKDFNDKELLKSMLCEFMQDFQKDNPNLVVFNEVIHMDEATPHLHIDFVPFSTRQKQGLSKKISLKSALAEQGVFGKDKKHTEWQVWCDAQKKIFGNIAISHGFEVQHKDVSKAHLNSDDYREQRQLVDRTQRELETAQAKLSSLRMELTLKNSDYTKYVSKVERLSQQKKSLKNEISNLSSEISRLNEVNSQLANKNRTQQDKITELQEQVNNLIAQIGYLEEFKTKILNPSQVDEFTITKKVFGSGVTIKSTNKDNNVGMYLQQLINMAKNYESMQLQRNQAIVELEKALSEREIALKEKNAEIERSHTIEHNAKVQEKLRARDELNQLTLCKRLLNVPKDIDTYDKLHKYLNGGVNSRKKTQ